MRIVRTQAGERDGRSEGLYGFGDVRTAAATPAREVTHCRRGAGRGGQVGFRLITGGASLKWPIFENVSYLDLNIFSIDLDVRDVPNKDGVLVSVQAVANVKIRSDEVSLTAAAERFLARSTEEIKQIAYKNLEGHLRSIVGRLTVEEIVRDRAKFNQEVLTEAAANLAKIGLGVDVLTIQKVSDAEGYIEALGKKRTAEVKRDAQIGESLAAREATIQSTTALREGKEMENQNLALVAQAEKERDVRKAQYEAEVLSQQAKAHQAGPLAEAKAKQDVVAQEVQVEVVRTTKQTEVAQAEAVQREQALLAEVVKPAEAAKAQTILQVEAAKQREILEAEGIKAKLLAEAEGALRKAQAFAPVAGAVAAPMGNIDKVVMADGGGEGASPLRRYPDTVPTTMFSVLQTAQALGLDISGLLKKLDVQESSEVAAKKTE